MNKAQRNIEAALLNNIATYLPAEKYPEVARQVLEYGSASQALGEAKSKKEIMDRVIEAIEDIGD